MALFLQKSIATLLPAACFPEITGTFRRPAKAFPPLSVSERLPK